MYDDLLNSQCLIYRLGGYDSYDFSSSEEGEVTEGWTLVDAVKCRVDRSYTGSQRRQDGMVELGSTTVFVQDDADIRDGDRLYCNGIYYVVNDSMEVYGMLDLHHKEIRASIIDWDNAT